MKYAGTDQTILPAYADQERARREDRLHRDDPEGHPEHRDGQRASPAWSSPTRCRPPTRWCRCSSARASTRSWCCIHQGGMPDKQKWTDPATGTTYDVNPNYDYTCGKGGTLAATSPILPIAANLDPAIDMVDLGHTHQPYVCDVKDPAGRPRLLTSASSFGRLFTETDLLYDKRTNDIVRGSVKGTNMQVSRDVTPDPAQTDADRPLQEAGHADREQGDRAHQHRRHRTTQNAAGESAARRPDRRRAARRPLGGDRWPDAGDRVHEPGRHPRRPDREQLQVRRADRRRHLRGGVQRPAVQQLPGLDDADRRSRSTTCWPSR